MTVEGVSFPASPDGSRSTTATGRAVVADALRGVDPVAARDVESIKNWRDGYLAGMRQLVVSSAASPEAALGVAGQGLASLYQRFVWTSASGDAALREGVRAEAEPPDTFEVIGQGEQVKDLCVPYRGRQLTTGALHRQLARWVGDGVVEPSFGDAIRAVMANPEWLDLRDVNVALIGAGAEMGPLRHLLDWGASVWAVDLPRSETWQRVLAAGRLGAGRICVPVQRRSVQLDTASDARVARVAGLDVSRQAPALLAWLSEIDEALTLGNHAYADGAQHARVSMAIDAVSEALSMRNPDLSLAFLATPTDVFAVPADAVAMSRQRWQDRRSRRVLQAPLHLIHLFEQNYTQTVTDATGHEVGIADCLVPQQGPNYALAKRLQRWRAVIARERGQTVSLNVAPATRTRSVLKNRALAAAYAGAGTFGIEVFDPDTANTLMAALLVRDLRDPASAANPATPLHNPMDLFADAAIHGGLWRTAYEPRSVLSVAAVLGMIQRDG